MGDLGGQIGDILLFSPKVVVRVSDKTGSLRSTLIGTLWYKKYLTSIAQREIRDDSLIQHY